MFSEKPPDLHAYAIKLKFKYRFTIKGYETILGEGTLIVSDQSTEDDVKQAVNDYVLKRIIEFLRGKPIDSNKDFAIDSNVEIISAVKVEQSITNKHEAARATRRLASNKHLVILVSLLLVLLMFLIVV